MKIYVDADACPVKNEIERIALKRNIEVIHAFALPVMNRSAPGVTMMQIAAGPDAVDDWIAENCAAGDLVITSDIPLAVKVVARGAVALEFRGNLLDERNTADRSQIRDLIMALHDRGEINTGPPPFGKNDRSKFSHALGRVLDKLSPQRQAAQPPVHQKSES